MGVRRSRTRGDRRPSAPDPTTARAEAPDRDRAPGAATRSTTAEQTWAASRAYGCAESYGAARVGDQVIGVSVSGGTAASRDLLTEVLSAITAEVVGHGSPTGGG